MGLPKIRVASKNEDIVIRDPKTKERITTKGKVVPRNSFWIRRLKAGDVVELPLSPEPEIETKEILTDEGEENDNSVQ